MGVKMDEAVDSAGREWFADAYRKGMGTPPLKCKFCPAAVTHTPSYSQARDDKPVLVSAFFKLMPNSRHGYNCKFAVREKLDIIARESEGLLETIRDGGYRLRLVMIKEALAAESSKRARGGGGPAERTGKTYSKAADKLPGYINSARKVLQLRALCDDDAEIAEHLELVFTDDMVVRWSQFYVETERHLDAYHAIVGNAIQYPIALHGHVKKKRLNTGKTGRSHVLNLQKDRNRQNPDDAENGISVEVSVWSEDAGWFDGIEEGDEVVVLGLWKANAGTPTVPDTAGRYKTFTTHKLRLNLVLMAQVAKVPGR
jgi:hypothetical protein